MINDARLVQRIVRRSAIARLLVQIGRLDSTPTAFSAVRQSMCSGPQSGLETSARRLVMMRTKGRRKLFIPARYAVPNSSGVQAGRKRITRRIALSLAETNAQSGRKKLSSPETWRSSIPGT